MSTEAKIKQLDKGKIRTFVDRMCGRGTDAAPCGPSQPQLRLACDYIDALLAEIARKDSVFKAACTELGQSRHLLEAGEELAEVAKLPCNTRVIEGKRLSGSWTAIPTGDFDLIRAAWAAYQEAAKT